MSNSPRSEPAAAGAAAPLHVYDAVESTNDLALALAAAGAVDGTAVLADQQTAGRGRHGRTWWSPPGAGLYLSIVVRVADAPADLAPLTLAAGVAAADAIGARTGLPVELKWPNDVVIGRPWRKLAGILCEGHQLGTPDAVVIVGIGVNLRRSAYPPAIADRATSIAEECGRDVDRDALVADIRRGLDEAVAELRAGRRDQVLARWRARGAAALERAPVRWREGGEDRRGMTVGLDADGALLVRTAGVDTPTRLVAGEVVWEMLTRE